MLEALLYANLSCTDVVDVLDRIKAHKNIDSVVKSELVVTLKEATPHCDWDAND